MIKEERKVGRQRSQFGLVPLTANQQVLAALIQLCQMQNEIPNVGANSKIIELANVECDPHSGVVSPSPEASSGVSTFSRASFSGKLSSPKAFSRLSLLTPAA